MVDFIILTDFSGSAYLNTRPLGPYRIATECRRQGYSTEVIDFASFLSVDETKKILDKYMTSDTLALGWASNFTGKNKSLYNKTLDINNIQNLESITNNKNVGGYLHDEHEKELIDWVKTNYPRVKIICGGFKSPRASYYNVDFYVVGHAENSIITLLDSIKTNDYSNIRIHEYDGDFFIDSNKDYPVEDIDDVFTEWNEGDQIQSYEYIPVETARGCIFKCKFCSSPFIGKKKFDYIRDPDILYREMLEPMDRFGTTNYSLMDDTFNDSIEKLENFKEAVSRLPKSINYNCYARLDLIIRYPEMLDIMVETGLKAIYFGIETFNEYAAKSIGKGTDRELIKSKLLEIKQQYPHIRIFSSFIVGLPGEDLNSCQDTFDWLMNNEAVDDFKFNPLFLNYSINRQRFIDSSIFEKNPEKYGYRTQDGSSYWENDIMNFHDARNVAAHYTQEGKYHNKPAGWEYSIHHSCGPYGPTEARKKYKDIDWNLMIKSKFELVKEYFWNKEGFVPKHVEFGLNNISY